MPPINEHRNSPLSSEHIQYFANGYFNSRKGGCSRYIVLERSDLVDTDPNHVTARQGEGVAGNDAGAGHQKNTMREVVTVE